jgi:uncharacterized damage-inducible protein DinB
MPLTTELVIPSFYRNYISHVKDYELIDGLTLSNEALVKLLTCIPESKSEYRYQPGKWSIKELICHMLDAERIFAYRALRFARNDKTELAGFEENDYAIQANASARTLVGLMNEAQRLRSTTLDLFSSFTQEMLQRTGKANGTEISVNMLGYCIAGHETHHRVVLETRYLAS